MAQWLKALVTLPEDLGSISSTQIVTYNCNFSLRGSNTLFWLLWSLGTQMMPQTLMIKAKHAQKKFYKI